MKILMKSLITAAILGAGLALAQSVRAAYAQDEVVIDTLLGDPSQLPTADIQPPGVVRVLADVNVGPLMKTYSSRVKDCGNELTHVKLRVAEAALYVEDAGVTFDDGTNRSYSFARSFNSGYESPWINLSLFGPGDKCVTAVNVRARAANPGETSKVQVFGNFTR